MTNLYQKSYQTAKRAMLPIVGGLALLVSSSCSTPQMENLVGVAAGAAAGSPNANLTAKQRWAYSNLGNGLQSDAQFGAAPRRQNMSAWDEIMANKPPQPTVIYVVPQNGTAQPQQAQKEGSYVSKWGVPYKWEDRTDMDPGCFNVINRQIKEDEMSLYRRYIKDEKDGKIYEADLTAAELEVIEKRVNKKIKNDPVAKAREEKLRALREEFWKQERIRLSKE